MTDMIPTKNAIRSNSSLGDSFSRQSSDSNTLNFEGKNMDTMMKDVHHATVATHASGWADCDELRTLFTLAVSQMYKEEVPLYGDLVRIVSSVNASVLASDMDPQVLAMRFGDVSQSRRLDIERHGAIRLGTAKELETVRRVFAVLGLFPVGYYDLSEAGLPMHATCFRPVTPGALRSNPFRVFTSVLRPELIQGTRARALAEQLTSRRSIFSGGELLRLLDVAAGQNGRLDHQQSGVFVTEALKIFQWHGQSTATPKEYSYMQAEHPVLADITCFRTSHINHLTPRTLDITVAQDKMEDEGMAVKDRIEGPPPRDCPILLRQTSFLAIEESIEFCADDFGVAHEQRRDSFQERGCHRARFGEIEERGAAVTPKGRALYDRLMREAMTLAKTSASATHRDTAAEARQTYDHILAETFAEFPDDWDTLRRQRLVYFSYRRASLEHSLETKSLSLDADLRLPARLNDLLSNGIIEAVPITYEDFLPLSAAGIFQSNIGNAPDGLDDNPAPRKGGPDLKGMEHAMRAKIIDPDDMYKAMEQRSIDDCARALGITIVF